MPLQLQVVFLLAITNAVNAHKLLTYEGKRNSYQMFKAIVSLGNASAAESICLNNICSSQQVILQHGMEKVNF